MRWCRENIFIFAGYKLILLEYKLFFELIQVLSRLKILFGEGLFVHSEAKTLCKTHGIIDVEFFCFLRSLLILKHDPHKLVVLREENILFVLQMMLMSIQILNNSCLCRAILLRIYFSRHYPFKFCFLRHSEWPTYRCRCSFWFINCLKLI